MTSETGWTFEIKMECNITAGHELIHELLPENEGINKVSYFRDAGQFSIRMENDIAGTECFEEKFAKATGLTLKITQPSQAHEKKAKPQLCDKPEGMLEQNKAMARIECAFGTTPHSLYKMSRKISDGIPYIELTFISPAIGELYCGLIEALEQETGWHILISSRVNQTAMIQKAKAICKRSGIDIAGNPSIFTSENIIRIKACTAVADGLKAATAQRVRETTGYDAEIIGNA
ncbi:MAG: hypothetical protein GF398_21575 [Chitinivibrionales bacterium]|nr:hypothetical protein [Chitinivibrionales bacterium]